jgi:hypothetical protein
MREYVDRAADKHAPGRCRVILSAVTLMENNLPEKACSLSPCIHANNQHTFGPLCRSSMHDTASVSSRDIANTPLYIRFKMHNPEIGNTAGTGVILADGYYKEFDAQ